MTDRKIPNDNEENTNKCTLYEYDENAWMKEVTLPYSDTIIKHLEGENTKYSSLSTRWEDDKEELLHEMRQWIPEEETSPPYTYGDYIYYKKIIQAENYWSHWRMDKDEKNHKLILDENEMAKESQFFNLGDLVISPDGEKAIFSCDSLGNERYRIYVKAIESGDIIDSSVSDAFESIVAIKDGFFYVPTGSTWRAREVKFHKIGTSPEEDISIYSELDDTYSVSISKSESERFTWINVHCGNDNEILAIENTTLGLHKITHRLQGLTCQISHHSDYFYLILNDRGDNNRIARAAIDTFITVASDDAGGAGGGADGADGTAGAGTGTASGLSAPLSHNSAAHTSSHAIAAQYSKIWSEFAEEMLPHDADFNISDIASYASNLVVEKQKCGLKTLHIYDTDFKTERKIEFPDETYEVSIMCAEYDTMCFKYSYSSLSSPKKVIERNFLTDSVKILHTFFTPSKFDHNNYEVKRLTVGKNRIPISLVRKKSSSNKPLSTILYGYGSYGISIPTSFRSTIIPLLDRNICFAIAHVRGGGDINRKWYEYGKLLQKHNSFDDFIKCAEFLKNENFSDNIVIHGGSAGGMLVGAAVNMRPDLFSGVIADVPFVDVLNTMLDESLPLTPGEYKEWGNPQKSKEYFNYIKSYSPYDNIKPQKYPHILATAGLHDPRVTYWEPAKWVARLQKYNTNPNSLIMLKTDMHGGHCGQSSRSKWLEEKSEHYAFALYALSTNQ